VVEEEEAEGAGRESFGKPREDLRPATCAGVIRACRSKRRIIQPGKVTFISLISLGMHSGCDLLSHLCLRENYWPNADADLEILSGWVRSAFSKPLRLIRRSRGRDTALLMKVI
jgi:hypothetical protein